MIMLTDAMFAVHAKLHDNQQLLPGDN